MAGKNKRPKVKAEVLKRHRDRPGAKVVEAPTAKQVQANPGARGYDETGRVRPADARAAFLVVPPDPEAAADVAEETEPETIRRASTRDGSPDPDTTPTGAEADQTPAPPGPESAGDSTLPVDSGAGEG